MATLSVVITPSHTGEGWGGVRCLLHATRCGKSGGDSREDGDYYVEDFTPESVVVEGSHFVLDYRVQSTELKHSEYRVQIVNRLG